MQNTPISPSDSYHHALHSAILAIVSAMNQPERDIALLAAAGVRLDRALFPLLVAIQRFGPTGVQNLADRIGRDYTTVSRQITKLASLGLVERWPCIDDRRIHAAVLSAAGKAMTDKLDAARDRLWQAALADWEPQERDMLVQLLQKFADALNLVEN